MQLLSIDVGLINLSYAIAIRTKTKYKMYNT